MIPAMMRSWFIAAAVVAAAFVTLSAQTLTPAPGRRSDEGRGPFKTLVVRGATLIDGTGAPPVGPVDIVIENNRIQAVRSAGTPGVPLRANRAAAVAELEIDATGMYVLPGSSACMNMPASAPKNPDAEYPYKLWLAHGVTTVVGVPLTATRSRSRNASGATATRSSRRGS